MNLERRQIPEWLKIPPEMYWKLNPETIKQFKKFLKLIHKIQKKKHADVV